MKKISLTTAVTAMSLTLGSMSGFADEAALEARIAKLEAQLAQLLEQQTQVASKHSGVQEERLDQLVTANDKGMRNPATGSTFTYGGFARLDSIVSDYSGGTSANNGTGDDFLEASSIPIGGEDEGVKTDMHAKATRFWFKTNTPTDNGGQVNTNIELDFVAGEQGNERISNSYAARLRLAYLEWARDDGSSWLFGQDWSTFVNNPARPAVLDLTGPVGMAFMRQAQIRYTNGPLMLALENPSTGLYGYGDIKGGNNFDNNTLPDLIARYNGTAGSLDWSVSGMAREISYREGEQDDSSYAGAFSLAGIWNLGADNLRFMLNYGALGRYMGLQTYQDGVITADGDIKIIDQIGGYLAYSHRWDRYWNSMLVLSLSEANNPDILADSNTPSRYSSVHANLTYQPTPDLTVGGELIYAEKQIEGEVNGEDSGELTRLQFVTRYDF